MGRLGTLTRFTALVLILGITCSPLALASDADASIRGVVHSAVSRLPMVGAKLYAADRSTGEVFRSGTTDKAGKFRIEALPGATYELAVESNQGLYLVGSPLTLAPGAAQEVELSVNDSRRNEANDGSTTTAGQTGGVWNNPATAALIVLGAALVVGLIVEETTEDDEAASGF